MKLERQLTSQCSGGRRWRVGCGGAGAVGDIRPMLPRSLREPVPLPLRRLRPCPPTACVEGNRLGGREGGCATCSKVRHQYCGNFEGNFFFTLCKNIGCYRTRALCEIFCHSSWVYFGPPPPAARPPALFLWRKINSGMLVSLCGSCYLVRMVCCR